MSWRIVSEYRRVLSRESGTVVKDWGGRISIALAFPHNYHTAMSNLGFQSIYGLLNDFRDVVCERVVMPDPGLRAEYERTGTTLLSLESQRPVHEFEIMAFSLSHENDYPGALKMLEMAGLAKRRDDRRPQDPAVMAGGVAMRGNPEPMADFFDLVLIGDGEIIIPPMIRAWSGIRTSPLPTETRILHLARTVPGAYAPAFYEAALDGGGRLVSFSPTHPDLPEKITVARAEHMPEPALATRIMTQDTEFAKTRLVEIGRGCTRGCRFCLAGYVYRPPRFAPMKQILGAIDSSSDSKPERVGLISPVAADHPQLEETVRALAEKGHEVSVSSLRVESLTPSLVEALDLGRQKSAAVAPEAGSQRLRNYINKGLTEDSILKGVSILSEAHITRLKLYFMIGLPSETEEDVAAIADLARKIRDRFVQRSGKKTRPAVSVSLSAFIPKPHTPFGIMPMMEPGELTRRAKKLTQSLKGEKGLKVQFDSPRSSFLQALFSRGDRRVGRIIDAMSSNMNLRAAAKKTAVDPDPHVLRYMGEDKLLPWSFIDHGLNQGFLEKEIERALEERLTPPCRPETCRLCGVCNSRMDEDSMGQRMDGRIDGTMSGKDQS